MKRLLYICFLLQVSLARGSDPVADFKALVEKFPKASTSKSTKAAYAIEDVKFDVKKTDSLINPILGVVDFTTSTQVAPDRSIELRLEMIFHWEHERWVFVKLWNPRNGVDFTHASGGLDLTESGALKAFLAPTRE